MPGSIINRSITIASGQAKSDAFPLNGYRIAAVIGDTAWTAADISFEVDNGVGSFVKVVDNAGALVKITGVATAASEYMIPPEIADVICGQAAKVVSTNTASEADVTQGAQRSLRVILAPLP
jgi:hypothetical protein